jgi:hypothetical protein
MANPMPKNLIYIGYARGQDDALAQEFENQLALLENPPHSLKRWSERNIPPGATTDREIEEHLAQARVIALVVTARFLSDPHCQKLLDRALVLRQAGQAEVVPIIGDFCLWDLSPLGQLNPLPDRDRPVKDFSNRDEAWNKVVRGILQVATAQASAAPAGPLKSQAASSPPPQQPSVPTAPPTRSAVRKRIEAELRDDADFNAFCSDEFPDVHRRFSGGMNRVEKTTLLLLHARLEDIVARLDDRR